MNKKSILISLALFISIFLCLYKDHKKLNKSINSDVKAKNNNLYKEKGKLEIQKKINQNFSKRYDDAIKNRKMKKKQDIKVDEYNDQLSRAEGLFEGEKYQEAFEIFLELAEKGFSTAILRIGEMYHFGLGKQINYQEAYSWYIEAFEKGNEVAPNKIGRLFLNGEGFNKDEHEALKWYKHSAERGHPIAMYNVAHSYEFNKDLNEKLNAYKWYKKSWSALKCGSRKNSSFCKEISTAIIRLKKTLN